MKVLVITEDPTHDQYLVKPVVEQLFVDLGRQASVEILRDPHLRGIDEALDPAVVAGIVQDNPMIDLFLLVVDRDCDRFRNTARAAARVADHPERLLACLAREEVEVWMLALHKKALGVPWKQVRAHCDPKEAFADPLLRRLGSTGPGFGRKRAMRALSGQWRSLLTSCRELKELRDEIGAWIAAR